ncbi:hypothetical protein [Rhizosaccharibacter radicis]|uniref:Uncharacterized protein n=1 Tax=Rhizosaccharibacter radicis TaxID=2782605 RepID=A0ABT1VW48_9PROT|nr:hypothetical protein [Acetobacteraceae bacterium KSS12]
MTTRVIVSVLPSTNSSAVFISNAAGEWTQVAAVGPTGGVVEVLVFEGQSVGIVEDHDAEIPGVPASARSIAGDGASPTAPAA